MLFRPFYLSIISPRAPSKAGGGDLMSWGGNGGHYFWEVFPDSRKPQEDEWSSPVTRLSKSPGDFFNLEFSFLTTNLKGTVSPDFEGFFYDLRYQICTFCVGADGF